MKALLRVAGTWLLGLALILIIVDGTRSLAADGLILTPIADLWAGLDETSWLALQNAVAQYLAPWGGDFVANIVLGWPGWLVSCAIGLLLLIAGRKRRRNTYVTAG